MPCNVNNLCTGLGIANTEQVMALSTYSDKDYYDFFQKNCEKIYGPYALAPLQGGTISDWHASKNCDVNSKDYLPKDLQSGCTNIDGDNVGAILSNINNDLLLFKEKDCKGEAGYLSTKLYNKLKGAQFCKGPESNALPPDTKIKIYNIDRIKGNATDTGKTEPLSFYNNKLKSVGAFPDSSTYKSTRFQGTTCNYDNEYYVACCQDKAGDFSSRCPVETYGDKKDDTKCKDLTTSYCSENSNSPLCKKPNDKPNDKPDDKKNNNELYFIIGGVSFIFLILFILFIIILV